MSSWIASFDCSTAESYSKFDHVARESRKIDDFYERHLASKDVASNQC